MRRTDILVQLKSDSDNIAYWLTVTRTNHAVVELRNRSGEVELEAIAGLVLDLRSHFVLVRVFGLNLTESGGLAVLWRDRCVLVVADFSRRYRRRRRRQGRVVEVNQRHDAGEERKNDRKRLKSTSK